jgi:hypothetical protein
MTRYKSIILITLAVFLVLAFVSFLVITSPNRTSTTPDLIQRAFDRGEITAEQKWLYLTYAVYEDESLPARFRGKVPWEATMSLLSEMDVAMHSRSVFCSMSPFVQSEIRRLHKSDTICD